jgi:hypothetical protein
MADNSGGIMIDGSMTFTAVREADTSEVTGVQILVVSGKYKWKSRLLSPGEFAELMLASRIFPWVKTDNLFLRVRELGQITEENVFLTEERIRFLGLRHSE